MEETLERSELVIESVFEDAALKRDLFNQMAEILAARSVPPDQITPPSGSERSDDAGEDCGGAAALRAEEAAAELEQPQGQ